METHGDHSQQYLALLRFTFITLSSNLCLLIIFSPFNLRTIIREYDLVRSLMVIPKRTI